MGKGKGKGAGEGKPSEGRKKAAMNKIENEDARNECFSKGKETIFAEASGLSTMCGAEVAVLFRSPTGTSYTFGSPSAGNVFSRFEIGESSQNPSPNPTMLHQLSQQFKDLTERLYAANAKSVVLKERMTKAASKAKECEWINKIDQLGGDELTHLLESMRQVKSNLIARMKDLSVEGSSVHESMRTLSTVEGGDGGGTLPSDMDVSNDMLSDEGKASGGVAPGVAPSPNAPNGSPMSKL